MATYISHSAEETQALGEAWGRAATPGMVIWLSGDLGAGKTQLAKGIARGLGVPDRVHSPTFTLVNQYDGGRLPLFHIDLYRLDTPEQVVGAGLREYFDPAGIAVIEWAERWLGKEAQTDVLNHATADPSLSPSPPSAGERAGVRGQEFAAVDKSPDVLHAPSPHPGLAAAELGEKGGESFFSLAPSEGERAGVRGRGSAAVDKSPDLLHAPSPHPDPLPFGRGEGTRDDEKIANPASEPILRDRRVLLEVVDESTRKITYDDFGA